jgi:dynein heavy chain
VKERVRVSEETEIEINQLRLEYKPVAVRASIMFFVTGDMAQIDPMYQYSLEFFRDLVNGCIVNAPKTDDRLGTLISRITYSTYLTVSRGLFEQHRPLFAFAICAAIMRSCDELSSFEWETFIRGPSLIDNPVENPLPLLIADARWNQLYALGRVFTSFAPIPARICSNIEGFAEFLTSDSTEIPKCFGDGLKEFERLLFFRTVAVDRLSRVIHAFVEEHMGVEFTRSPPFDLKQSYKDTRPATPLIFILSQGADPRDHLLRLAAEVGMESRLKMRSLGQGQGPEAERAIQGALTRGEWVYLQNCHLSLSWLPELEAIVSKFNSESAHKDFRLFLSSMPTDGFPVAILRNSVKVTNEPPRGIRAHLLRLLGSMTSDDYEACTKPRQWKKLLFGLAFFHAVIQERKKFGPLGFNKVYEWTETDFNVSVSYLRMFLDEQANVPWDALRFLTGEIIYGGRVTDDWDRRCMMSIMYRYYSEPILEDGYFLARGATYYAPPAEGMTLLMGYVESLPFEDDHDVFQMHANAEITNRRRVSESLLSTLQSSVGGSVSGSAGTEAVLQLVHDLLEKMPRLNPITSMHESLLGNREDENAILDPLTVVLKQEVERWHRLLKLLVESLKELEKALKGLVSMSPLLEDVLQSLFVNRVPEAWKKYESMKPLGSWFSELIKRIEFFNSWMRYGNPPSFWLSAFYFPQSFLTGILQRHSRLQGLPIDSLSFELDVLEEEPRNFPEIGVNINGLVFDGAKWNAEKGCIDEQERGQIYSDAPYLHLRPTDSNVQTTSGYYQCPVYITAAREGILSTTGTSTNFVVALPLGTREPPDHWIQRGAAMLLGTPE